MVADVVKEGIKSSGKAAVGIGSDTATSGPEQFFERQLLALTNLNEQHGYTINNTEANLRLQDPVTAANAMRVVWTQLDAHKVAAHDLQKRATSTQWMSALARTDSGIRQATDELGRDVEATSMSRAGEQQVLPRHKNLASGGPIRGVLQIAVEVEEPLGERVPKFQIKQAWIHGVPAAMGNDLAAANLAAMPVPVVVRLEGADVTQITRDELGVIEVRNREGGDMAQAHRTAKDLLDRVLWIPLADRGVRVETDDK